MKNLASVIIAVILAVAALLFLGCTKAFGQSFEGLTLKVMPKAEVLQKYGYDDFYTKPTTMHKIESHELLANREFVVIGTTETSRSVFLNLLCETTGDTLYYKYEAYRKASQFDETFEILSAPDEYYCSQLRHTEDKFDASKSSSSSPFSNDVRFHVYGSGSIYLSLTSYHSNVGEHGNGVYILFDDGSKFELPNEETEIDTPSSGSSMWRQTAFVAITKEHLLMFSKKTITDIRLYVYDNSIKQAEGKSFKGFASCLLKMINE